MALRTWKKRCGPGGGLREVAADRPGILVTYEEVLERHHWERRDSVRGGESLKANHLDELAPTVHRSSSVRQHADQRRGFFACAGLVPCICLLDLTPSTLWKAAPALPIVWR